MPYSAISIIYNPASTGPGHQHALALRRELRRRLPELRANIRIIATRRTSHAERLAYEAAMASPDPLIIASGGDGTYHEVVNGAMLAQAEGARPVCGLLPGGNANDHYHSLHTQPLEEQVVSGKVRTIDLLRITIQAASGQQVRYAHSYCGFGLTAEIGRELNKFKLNPVREAVIVAKGLWRLRSKKVIIHGHDQTYTSLICSNVPRMSKVLRLSNRPRLGDGQFELVRVHGTRKSVLLRSLLRASLLGLRQTRRSSSFSFTTIKPLRLQIDGELYRLSGNTTVHVDCLRQHLRCIV